MAITVVSTKWPYSVKEPIDPGAVLNYGIDWTEWLPVGASLHAAVWTVVGGVVEHSAIVDGTTLIWLSVEPEAFQVSATVHITADTAPVALEDERTLILNVKER